MESQKENSPQCGCSQKTKPMVQISDYRPETHPQTVSENRRCAWIVGTVNTPIGNIPQVSTILSFADHFGSWKARWGINRMHYRIEPGLYAVGNPTAESPVIVTANYKMSFDRLRSQLGGWNFWILVLETYGINVWCAAGKGTFGTEEIIQRIQSVRLDEVVTHRELILPQLGAPGVNRNEVRQQSGFRVTYGPVRAQDIPAFMQAGKQATPEMRRVNFTLRDRIVLSPMEFIMSLKYAFFISAGLFFLAGLSAEGYSMDRAFSLGTASTMLFLSVYLTGVILSPALLPWLPGRSFAAKGAWLGLALILCIWAYTWFHYDLFENSIRTASWLLLGPTVASFLTMLFTGASTYTSLSGVRKEMRIAVPAQIVGASIGLGLWLTALFL